MGLLIKRWKSRTLVRMWPAAKPDRALSHPASLQSSGVPSGPGPKWCCECLGLLHTYNYLHGLSPCTGVPNGAGYGLQVPMHTHTCAQGLRRSHFLGHMGQGHGPHGSTDAARVSCTGTCLATCGATVKTKVVGCAATCSGYLHLKERQLIWQITVNFATIMQALHQSDP